MQRSVPAPMPKPQTVKWDDQPPQPSSHNGFARQLIPVSTLHNTRVLHDKVTHLLHRYVERLLAHTPCHSHAPAQTCTSKRSLMQSVTGCSQYVKSILICTKAIPLKVHTAQPTFAIRDVQPLRCNSTFNCHKRS